MTCIIYKVLRGRVAGASCVFRECMNAMYAIHEFALVSLVMVLKCSAGSRRRNCEQKQVTG